MKNLPTDGHLIYVVDDETDIRRLITIYVSVSGFQVKGFSNGADCAVSKPMSLT
jgi:FixJ family two-component response regulator